MGVSPRVVGGSGSDCRSILAATACQSAAQRSAGRQQRLSHPHGYGAWGQKWQWGRGQGASPHAGSPEEGYTITEGFVAAMLERFREQKKIHPRFAFEIVLGALRVLQQLPTLVDIEIPSGARRLLAPIGHLGWG